MAFRISGVAAFQIERGRRIVVDAVPDQAPRNINLYLLGTAMGLLLMQRGDIPLHANAIGVGSGAVAVMGPSGIGKSTLAATALDRGLPLLSDDVAVIRVSNGSAVVSPGLSRLRLWKDTIEARGDDPEDWPRAYLSHEPWDKFDVAVKSLERTPRRLDAIYQLTLGEELRIVPATGADAVQMLTENVYRGDWATSLQNREAIFRWAATLVERVRIYRLSRPWRLDGVDDILDSILINEKASLLTCVSP